MAADRSASFPTDADLAQRVADVKAGKGVKLDDLLAELGFSREELLKDD